MFGNSQVGAIPDLEKMRTLLARFDKTWVDFEKLYFEDKKAKKQITLRTKKFFEDKKYFEDKNKKYFEDEGALALRSEDRNPPNSAKLPSENSSASQSLRSESSCLEKCPI